MNDESRNHGSAGASTLFAALSQPLAINLVTKDNVFSNVVENSLLVEYYVHNTSEIVGAAAKVEFQEQDGSSYEARVTYVNCTTPLHA